MVNSNMLDFLYKKWLMFLAWYEKSVSSKIIKKIYGAISGAWTNSLFVSSFCSAGNGTHKKSLIYTIFYLPFAFLSLFANDWAVRLFAKIKKPFCIRRCIVL